MHEHSDSRLPAGLIWLLIYQGILVMISLGYSVAATDALWDSLSKGFRAFDVAALSAAILVLAGWAALMLIASVGLVRRRPRGLLLGMIGHLLAEIPSVLGVLGFGLMSILAMEWAPLFLIFALMWLPPVLLSGWGYFYLRDLRRQWLPQGPDGPNNKE